MWEFLIFLAGLWAIASVVLPIVAIVKVLNQQKQIAHIQRYIQHLEHTIRQVQSIKQVTSSSISQQPEHITDLQHPTIQNNEPIIQDLPSQSIPVTTFDLANNPLQTPELEITKPKETETSFVASSIESVDESSTNVVTSLFLSLKNWFFGENLIVRVGAIILLVGVVLLLKLASQYINVPITLRMAGVALAGLVITSIGYRISQSRRNYGLTLQGVGFAMIYLTVFASFRLYNLLPSSLTFALLAILAGLTVMFSVWQNALPLAILAFGGAFLAPLLVSDPQGSAVTLFSYYLLLNVAVAVIAHYHTWKLLNALSLVVTFGLAYVWGFNQYINTTEHLKVWQIARWQLVGLLAAHMTLYVFIVIRYSQQVIAYNTQRQQSLVSIDSGLLFGTPLLGFGLLAALLHDLPYHLALASSLLSGVYLALGFWLLKKYSHKLELSKPSQQYQNSFQLLIEATLALGIAFLALILPLALSAKWLVIGWAVQGASLVWLGQRTYRRWTVWFGLALQALTISILLNFYELQSVWYELLDTIGISHALPISDFSVILPLIITTLTVGISAFLLRQRFADIGLDNIQNTDKSATTIATKAQLSSTNLVKYLKTYTKQKTFIAYFLVIVFVFLYVKSSLIGLEHLNYTQAQQSVGLALLCSVALLIGQKLHERFIWEVFRVVSRFLIPIVMLLFYFIWLNYFSPNQIYYDGLNPIKASLQGFGFAIGGLVGITAIATLLGSWFISRWYGEGKNTSADQLAWLLSLITLMTWALAAIAIDNDEVNQLLIILPTVLSVLALIVVDYLSTKRQVLPQIMAWLNPLLLLKSSGYVLVPATFLWLIMSNFRLTGQALGFYLPIINPLDLLLISILLYMAFITIHVVPKFRELLASVLVFATIFTLSSMLVRTFGYFMHTSTWNNGAWQVSEIQTGLTILWSILATTLMFLASKKALRQLWYVGMSLLALVVIKLVIIDMSKTSAILRVISFIGAGGLMLLIGYLAPLPPKAISSQDDN